MAEGVVRNRLLRIAHERKDNCLLLLALIGMLDRGWDNRLKLVDLEPVLLEHMSLLDDGENEGIEFERAFWQFASNGLWQFTAKAGKEHILKVCDGPISREELREALEYASLTGEVYNYLADEAERKSLERELFDILSHVDVESLVVREATSLFRHEQEAIDRIRQQVKRFKLGRMISNVNIYDKASNTYLECDVILVAHSGIFIIELKHWSGHTNVGAYHWLRNGTNYVASPHKANTHKCKVLKGIYEHRFKTFPNIWVESVVVFTHPNSTVEGHSSPSIADDPTKHNPTFASISDLVAYLRKKNEQRILSDRHIDFVADYLCEIGTEKKGLEYTVPGYETVEYLYQSPHMIEMVARPLSGHVRGLARFRVFLTPPQATSAERERFIARGRNTIRAVSRIGDHSNIHKVMLAPNEYDDIVEMSDWSETGTLRDLLARTKGPLAVESAMEIALGIARGLQAAHESGVIHRAVKPENVLLMNDIPKLTNFDLSYQLEDNRITVIAQDSLKDDGYVAPEVLSHQDIDEGTDLFSLAAITYEMVTGQKAFSKTRDFLAKGGTLTDAAKGQLMKVDGLSLAAKQAIIEMLVGDRRARLKDIDRVIAAFSAHIEKEQSPLEGHNAKLKPGDTHDLYWIHEFIGEGREAQVYKAETKEKTGQTRLVAIKLFNKEVPQEKIFKECEITSSIKSSYVVGCDNKPGHWNKDRYFIVLDFIDGESMRSKIESGQRPSIDLFRSVAISLMDAVAAFHEYEDASGEPRVLIHGDIKPDNILLTEDNKPVLIDCGLAGEPRVGVFEGTNGYVPPDSIRGSDMQFSPSGDLFALGVTLWEWVFGKRPYENPVVGAAAQLPDGIDPDLEPYLAWLQKAVATEADKRFASISELKEAFIKCGSRDEENVAEEHADKKEGAVAVLERTMETINPFVSYMNTLSNASAGNENATAENQIGNEFFAKIHVQNPVTEYIYERLVINRENVILTGNAGDGKTTIAAEIVGRVTGCMPRSLGEREEIEDAGLVIIKDMSEIDPHPRANILREAASSQEKKYLIISNTGTLLAAFRELGGDANELLSALQSDSPQRVFNNKFVLINIGRVNSIATAVEAFVRMLDKDNWASCDACGRSDLCPIHRNVRLLQSRLPQVRERISLLYRRLYEYDTRLTLRQMTGHLAYAITAGRDCRDIFAMSRLALEDKLLGSMFFNRFFGDDGQDVAPEAMQLLAVRSIRQAGFGLFLDPLFEREAWTKDNLLFSLSEAAEIYERLQKMSSILEGPEIVRAVRRQSRRLVYFFGELDNHLGRRFICTFLQSPNLLAFLDYGKGKLGSTGDQRRYRDHVLQVLQEHFLGIRLPDKDWKMRDLYITLKPKGHGTRTQMIVASLREDDFRLMLQPRYRLGEEADRILCLSYKDGAASLPLDLPFLDYVSRRYEGDVTQELSANYANRLDRFKVELLNAYANHENDRLRGDTSLRLLWIDSDYNLHPLEIRIAGDELEVV